MLPASIFCISPCCVSLACPSWVLTIEPMASLVPGPGSSTKPQPRPHGRFIHGLRVQGKLCSRREQGKEQVSSSCHDDQLLGVYLLFVADRDQTPDAGFQPTEVLRLHMLRSQSIHLRKCLWGKKLPTKHISEFYSSLLIFIINLQMCF